MPLYIADYLADTAHLSAAESGAYLHLIMHYWQKGSLPTDDRHLARIARMTDAEWTEHRSSIASFFQDDWRHDRVERELAAANSKYEKRANAGRKGGNAKAKSKPSSSNATSNARAGLYQPQLHSQEDSSSESVVQVPHAGLIGEKTESREPDPRPPVSLPTEPAAIYDLAELKGFAFEFDGVDVDQAVRELAHWTNRKGIADPIERKNAIYGALQKRHAKAKLHDSLKAPAPASASRELLGSKLVRRVA